MYPSNRQLINELAYALAAFADADAEEEELRWTVKPGSGQGDCGDVARWAAAVRRSGDARERLSAAWNACDERGLVPIIGR